MRPSIVIPAYNAAKTLPQTLAACKRQRWDGKPVEIVVVDDGSTDGTAEIAEQAGVRCIRQDNAGAAAARNTGWRAAAGDVICFTDSDCAPSKDWVSRLMRRLEADGLDGVGGSYGIENPESLLASCIHQEIWYRHRRMPATAWHLGSFNVCLQRAVLEDLGGFDEGYRGATAEDTDLSYKASERGYKLGFDASIKVGHYHPTKLFPYLRTQFGHAYWRAKLYRDHPDRRRSDGYTRLRDLVQPPLFLLLLGLLSLLWLAPARWVALALATLGAGLQVPSTAHALQRTKQTRHLAMIPIFFLRGFAWAMGAVWGLLVFSLRGVPERSKGATGNQGEAE